MIMQGKEVTLPLQAVIGNPQQNNDEPEVGTYVQDLQNRLKTAHDLARITLKKKTEYQKKYYDIKSTKRSLKVGQAVWMHDPARKKGVCHKLTNNWKGPYIVTNVRSHIFHGKPYG